MEAVPRLPMISFDLFTSSDRVSFGPKLKQYIASYYQEDEESYSTEVHNLETLRASAVWPSVDINSCLMMKKYFCQLHFLRSRFPMGLNEAAAVSFSWKDEYTKLSASIADIGFEQMVILTNIGAMHTKLGAEDSRTTPEGMKLACTHFQCAAWAYQEVLNEYYHMVPSLMVSIYQVRGMRSLCLAQAQECILEKSLLDNRKATIIAKIAKQLTEYYREALTAFQTGDDGIVIEHLPNYKYVLAYLLFKISYTNSLTLLYQGQHMEEQQKMGERVTLYNAAVEDLENARKHMSRMPSSSQGPFKDTLIFAMDVIEGKRKAATNENEFIYHEEVPTLQSLPEIKGASLVKGIQFSVHDNEVSGADIFGRLVPMAAHEASSLYSEQKAQMLRVMGERIESKDKELNEFLASLQLDILSQVKTAKGISQELVDRAASMVARPNAVKELVDAMGKLSNTYHEVEAMLKESQELLNEEEQAEKEYQEIMGKRPPSIVATDLTREMTKYQEAHNKASESNQNLHKAMTTHMANLKILAQPLGQLKMQIPSIQLPDSNIDESLVEKVEGLAGHIDKMRTQRNNLWTQLRDNVHKDDITNAVVTKDPEQPMDVLFQNELEKHKETRALIEQNLLAQENICKAMVEVYATFTPTRKYIADLLQKRSTMVANLISSYDAYDDLLAKANKGIEFYTKLETNVAKLLQRIKSACKVQQEEREQILMKNGHVRLPKKDNVEAGVAVTSKPKLKDYLDNRKGSDALLGPQMQYPTSSIYPEKQNWNEASTNQEVVNNQIWNNDAANRSSWGGEVNNKQQYVPPQTGFSQQCNNSVSISNYGRHGYTQVNYSDKKLDNNLVDKINTMKISSTNYQYDYANSQAYNYPITYSPAPALGVGTTSLHTSVSPQINTSNYSNPPSSYQTVSTTNYPYVAASEAPQTPNGTVLPNNAFPVNAGNTVNSAGSYGGYYDYNQHYSSVYNQPKSNSTNIKDQVEAGYGYVPPGNYTIPQAANMNSAVPLNQYSGITTPFATTVTTVPPSSYYSTTVTTNASIPPNNPTYQYSQSLPQTAQINQVVATNNTTVAQTIPQMNQITTQSNQTIQPNANVYTQNTAAYIQDSSTYPYQYMQTNTNQYVMNQPVSSQDNHYNYVGSNTTTNYPPTTTYNAQDYNTSYSKVNPYNPSATANYPQENNPYNQLTQVQYPQETNYASVPYNQSQFTYDHKNKTSVATQNPSCSQVGGLQYPQTNLSQHSQGTQASQDYNPYNQSSYSIQGSQTYNNYNQSQSTIYNQSSYIPTTITSSTYMQPLNSSSTYSQPSSIPSSYTHPSQSQPSETTTQKKSESSIDLLAGLDFSISQVPLVPQKESKKEVREAKQEIQEIMPMKKADDVKPDLIPVMKKSEKKLKKGEPFRSSDTIKQFIQEVEKFEKYVETLTVKTLSGPSALDLKWKELQDVQENAEAVKKSISVARCYPLKNRTPDILPYDFSRVELTSTKDDYINASHVKDISPYCMDFIITQAPLQSTLTEFWAMVWEQQIETLICLLSSNELGEEIYWPSEVGKELSIGNKFITTLSTTNKDDWVENKLNVMLPEQKENRIITLMQFRTWPGSLFPTNPLPFVQFLKEIITIYEQQKSTGNPVLVHCHSGVGRSGICAVLLAILMEFAATGSPLPDIPNIASKMSCARKNVIRDREHLKFVYVAFLNYIQVVKKDFTKSDNDKVEDKIQVQQQVTIDPFSTLDPLWATRKK